MNAARGKVATSRFAEAEPMPAHLVDRPQAPEVDTQLGHVTIVHRVAWNLYLHDDGSHDPILPPIGRVGISCAKASRDPPIRPCGAKLSTVDSWCRVTRIVTVTLWKDGDLPWVMACDGGSGERPQLIDCHHLRRHPSRSVAPRGRFCAMWG